MTLAIIRRWGWLGIALAVYVTFGIAGLRFGLPDQHHRLSYNCDETNWMEALTDLRPSTGYNPYPNFNQPAFFLETLAAATWIGIRTGYLSSSQSKDYFRQFPNEFARFFLVGRFLQIVYGAVLLLVLGFTTHHLFGPWTAIVATGFLCVTPGFVAASHFIQSNLPVTTLTFIAIACLMLDERHPGPSRRWLVAGSFFASLAFMTKFSAAPLAALVLYQAIRFESPLTNILRATIAATLGLIIGEPFVFLSYSKVFEAFKLISSQVLGLQSLGAAYYTPLQCFVFPFRYPLSFSLGTFQALIFWISLAWLLLKRPAGMRLPLIALGLFLPILMSVGMAATPGRMLFMAPLAVLCIARTGVVLWESGTRLLRGMLSVVGLLVISSSFSFSMMVLHLRRDIPTQKRASEWILTNIPVTARVGIPREPYYWSPDIILESHFWPHRLASPYKVNVLDFSIERAKTMEYILVAAQERSQAAVRGRDAYAFVPWLDQGDDFELIQAFPRSLSWGPIRWHRPEMVGLSDDDLWVYSYSIYRRRTRPRQPLS